MHILHTQMKWFPCCRVNLGTLSVWPWYRNALPSSPHPHPMQQPNLLIVSKSTHRYTSFSIYTPKINIQSILAHHFSSYTLLHYPPLLAIVSHRVPLLKYCICRPLSTSWIWNIFISTSLPTNMLSPKRDLRLKLKKKNKKNNDYMSDQTSRQDAHVYILLYQYCKTKSQ